MNRLILPALSLIAATFAQAQTPTPTPTPTLNLVQELSSRADLSTFYKFVNGTPLANQLMTTGSDGRGFTVFAPTDDAFANVPAQVLTAMKSDPDIAKQILEYSVVPVSQNLSDLQIGMNRLTLEGEGLELATAASGALITMTPLGLGAPVPSSTEALVVSPDVAATNGVIQVVNRVLLPPSLYPKLGIKVELGTN
jgi:uncharacterized surface protein with fasciclin (FAS1) repeats